MSSSDARVDPEPDRTVTPPGRDSIPHSDDPPTADAADVIPIFDRADMAESYHKGSLPPQKPPGFGSPYDDCGDDNPCFCCICANPSIRERTCYRSVCSRCAPAWARRQATSICSNLDALRRYRQSFKPHTQFFHHLVLSPPLSWTPDVDDPLEYTINVLKDVMDADDLEGVLFYHPYRGKNGDDRGFWKRILFSESEWEDVRDDIKFSPHFHAIVVGSRVIGDEDTKQVEAETGWLIDRITKHANEKVSLYDDYDLARAVTYCLSHTGLYQTDGGNTKAAYRRFGKNTQEVTCSEDREARMDAIVRSVSPRTLGLEFSNLACTVEVDPDRDGAEEFRYEVDPHRGGVSQSPDGSTSFTDLPFQSQAELPNKPQGLQDDRDATDFSDDVGGVPDDPDSDGSIDHSVQDDVDDETTQVCHGRLLPLSKAPELLDDADWVDQAPHADDLREFYEEWKEKLDWLG